MINDNIRRFRKAKGLTQEELAVRLNVVRQTVSKWENGLSVPDADILINISEILNVSVSQLLGVKEDNDIESNLSEELAKLNQELAKKNNKEKLVKQANQKRGLILLLSFLSMIIALTFKNEILSLLLVAICVIGAVIILYRNLALITSITTDDLRVGILRITTIFNIGILLIGIIFVLLTAFNFVTLTENGEKIFAMSITSCVILLGGIICPKLPYSKHTGLRLPWTIQDEDTWNVAHRIIGYISIPTVLLYIACTLSIDNFKFVTIFIMIIWIGIPGVISYIFFKNKIYGK